MNVPTSAAAPVAGPPTTPSDTGGPAAPALDAAEALVSAPLNQIAQRLRSSLAAYVRSSALIIFTEECSGRPQKKAGSERITGRVSIEELEDLRSRHPSGSPWRGMAVIGGESRDVLTMKSATNALLVLADPRPSFDAGEDQTAVLEPVERLWRLAALRIQERVAEAPPSYLLESRAASTERARVTAEMTDEHSVILETMLAALRDRGQDDHTTRKIVTEMAASALVRLRTAEDLSSTLTEEAVSTAFERLQDQLRPLLRFTGIDVEFVAPPANGRALPGEVAHAARAVVRSLTLAMVEQPKLSRVRVQWDCDGENLLIKVRDDGEGQLSMGANIKRLRQQIDAIDGELTSDVIPGWGTEVWIGLPLDSRASLRHSNAATRLGRRELDVLQHLAAGKRNKSIAAELQISENTVKYHVRNIFRKLGVSSRTEAIAYAHGARAPV